MNLTCLQTAVRWRISWLFVIVAVPVGVLFGGHFLAPLVEGPPTIVRSAVFLNPVIKSGEPLRLLIKTTTKPNLQCTAYVIREFNRDTLVDGRVLQEKRRMMLAAPPIPRQGEEEYVVVIPTPPLDVGEWRFFGRTTYDCGVLLGGIRNYDTPGLTFHVVP